MASGANSCAADSGGIRSFYCARCSEIFCDSCSSLHSGHFIYDLENSESLEFLAGPIDKMYNEELELHQKLLKRKEQLVEVYNKNQLVYSKFIRTLADNFQIAIDNLCAWKVNTAKQVKLVAEKRKLRVKSQLNVLSVYQEMLNCKVKAMGKLIQDPIEYQDIELETAANIDCLVSVPDLIVQDNGDLDSDIHNIIQEASNEFKAN